MTTPTPTTSSEVCELCGRERMAPFATATPSMCFAGWYADYPGHVIADRECRDIAITRLRSTVATLEERNRVLEAERECWRELARGLRESRSTGWPKAFDKATVLIEQFLASVEA